MRTDDYSKVVEKYEKTLTRVALQEGMGALEEQFKKLWNSSPEVIAEIALRYNEGKASREEQKFIEEYGWTKGLERFAKDEKSYFVPHGTTDAKRPWLGVPVSAEHDRLYVLKNQKRKAKSDIIIEGLVEGFDLPYADTYYHNSTLVTEYIFSHALYGAVVHVEVDAAGRIIEPAKDKTLSPNLGTAAEIPIYALVPGFVNENKVPTMVKILLTDFDRGIQSLYDRGRKSDSFPEITGENFPDLMSSKDKALIGDASFTGEERAKLSDIITARKISAADASLHQVVGESNMNIIDKVVGKRASSKERKIGVSTIPASGSK